MQQHSLTFKKALLVLLISMTIFFGFFTIFYPLSPYSFNQSYTYKKPWSVGTGGTYSEIVNKFVAQYETDLQNSYKQPVENYNRIIDLTQYILPIFQQQWIQDEQKTKITRNELLEMKIKLKSAKTIIYDLYTDWDMDYYIKSYLDNNLQSIDYDLQVIDELLNNPYYTRKELKTITGNMAQSYNVRFSTYLSLYKIAKETPPVYSLNESK